MALVRYRPNRRGIRDLLGSPEVLADLRLRAARVAITVRADYQARPPHQGSVDVVVDAGLEPESGRARAAVIAKHPGALGIEADRRPLGSALDAAG
ncbi:MAG: hypothetical protein GEV12_14320 [Micromonosporaceae bacterium]|nr:hypothetical protein [Micromonosporaceae bacterium]